MIIDFKRNTHNFWPVVINEYKEMIIDFKRNTHNFLPVVINGKQLSVSNSVKILGVTISANFKWNEHIHECIKRKKAFLIYRTL